MGDQEPNKEEGSDVAHGESPHEKNNLQACRAFKKKGPKSGDTDNKTERVTELL